MLCCKTDVTLFLKQLFCHFEILKSSSFENSVLLTGSFTDQDRCREGHSSHLVGGGEQVTAWVPDNGTSIIDSECPVTKSRQVLFENNQAV